MVLVMAVHILQTPCGLTFAAFEVGRLNPPSLVHTDPVSPHVH